MGNPLDFDHIEELVVRSQKGDEQSFEALFDFFYPKIHRYICFKVQPEEVDDLVSDTFLKVVKKISDYTLPVNRKTGFSSWIFRIANNTVIDFYRTQKYHISLEDEDTGELKFDIPDMELAPDQRLQADFEAKEVREALEKLSSYYKEILELKYLEGFSNTEIAHILQKTEGTIRIAQMRALREMKKFF